MPSNPASPPDVTVSEANVVYFEGLLPTNRRTVPPCSTTYHALLSLGACSNASDALNCRFVNGCIWIEPVFGRAHATQVLFDGRESSPGIAASGGAGAACVVAVAVA